MSRKLFFLVIYIISILTVGCSNLLNEVRINRKNQINTSNIANNILKMTQ